MRDIVYYPGFECENTDWLKFALLYFDNLRPIIPFIPLPEKEYLGEMFYKVKQTTDLIIPYNPDPDEYNVASMLACEEFSKYISNPNVYRGYFGYTDFLSNWRNSEKHNYLLYHGKFSRGFYDFCLDNGFATRHSYGILVPRELGFTYMSILADSISRRQDFDMITDVKRYSSYLIRKDNQIHSKNIEKIKTEIDLLIPEHIKSVSLDKIISLRGDPNFSECRKEYVKTLNLYLEKKKHNPEVSFDNLIQYKNDMVKIAGAGLSLSAHAFLTVYDFVSPEPAVSVANVCINAPSMLENIYGISSSLKRIHEKKLTRKYVAKLRNL